MNIRTCAQQSGVSKDTLRFYEKIGLIVPSRGENHYRDTTTAIKMQAGDDAMMTLFKKIGALND